MKPFSALNPEYHLEINDKTSGLKGYVVIDRNLNGIATGGIRMADDVTMEEVANLARAMTLKFAFLNIKKDGAKAGICASPLLTPDKKKEICFAFGKAISHLLNEGRYYPGEDLGINSRDLSHIFAGAGIKLTKENIIKSEFFTALTVFLSAKEILKSQNLRLEGQSIIIEGFGKVAIEAARLFVKSNARIIGISTSVGAIFDEAGLDINMLCRLKELHGDDLVTHCPKAKKIKKELLLIQKTDILIPGARPDSINMQNIEQIKAKIIVPIANVAATQEIEDQLFEKGITYIPDFVSNCGGILSYFLSEQGFKIQEIKEIISEGFTEKLNRIISEANTRKQSLSSIARETAEENIKKMERENLSSIYEKISLGKAGWIAYRLLGKIRAGFILNFFAKRYISLKLFV